ncbi:MAG TPA: serine/threonine-protein kinase [Thermoanaerobaculia bacterium]|nr:serine/threonine-protein kinase [Thermoanaerobaculia bacterium]
MSGGRDASRTDGDLAAANVAFWERVREVFHEAVALDSTARRELLADADARVREEVASLLASHDEAGDFLDTPILAHARLDHLTGSLVGPYRIVRLLGEGGMGAVYLGVREGAEFEQRVAVKVIRGGGESILRRFRQERQILAALEHPNIARMLDGGTTANGAPFLAMEYIEGTPIDEYAATHHLSVHERLRLFLTLCDAVQHAHRNLVIHRDIKPANVLITRDGVPKLLDFGIAKLISEVTVDATVTRMMTPDYASPEQLHGLPVSTATDVYSLGVLLYGLLANGKPFDGERRGDSEPVRPSLRNRALRGDLDNILMMALQSEPARRYGSVEQFAADIRRHLAGHPVTARPDTLLYRASKFTRRNKVVVAAAIVVAIVTAIAFMATLRQKRIAEHRFEQVRALARSFVFEIHDAIAPLPGSTRARELLVRRALVYLDGLAAEAQDSAELQRELARAYLRIGDVQGLPYQANLGDTAGALTSYRKALAIAERLLDDESSDEALLLAAEAHDRLGLVEQRALRWANAMEQHQTALALRGRVSAQGPNERVQLARTWVAIGDCRYVGGQRVAARFRGDGAAAYEEALRVLEHVPHRGAHLAELLNQIARANQRLGGYYSNPGRIAKFGPRCVAYHTAALHALEQRAALDASNAIAQRNVADQQVMTATAYVRLKDGANAVALAHSAIETLNALAAADPTNVEAQHDLAFAFETAGDGYAIDGKWDDAERAFQRCIDIRRKLVAGDASNREDLRGLAMEYERLAHVYEARGQGARAEKLRAESERMLAKM